MQDENSDRGGLTRLAAFLQSLGVDGVVTLLAGVAVVAISIWDFGSSALSSSTPGTGVMLHILLVAAGLILANLAFLKARTENLHEMLRGGSLAQIRSDIYQLGPAALRRVLERPGLRMLHNLETLLNERTVEIYNPESFPVIYEDILKACPGACFWATSLPRREYFWGIPGIIDTIRSFTTATASSPAGKMNRIFFLEREDDLNDPEVKEVLESQIEADVKVYTILRSRVPDQLNMLWMVDDTGRIAWRVIPSWNGRIAGFRLTTNEKYAGEFKTKMDEMRRLPDLKPYRGIGAARAAARSDRKSP